MGHAVMISIRPKWCDLIASGQKTIEVRKTRPKLDTPFKCYIYETLNKSKAYYNIFRESTVGQIIGEFVCDDILVCHEEDAGLIWDEEDCLTDAEFSEYTKGCQTVYGWHISDLKIYDTPKELSNFYAPCSSKCNYFEECGGTNAEMCLFPLKQPPQSWRYVEENVWRK